MNFLPIILIIFFLISLLLNFLSLASKKTAIKIVNDMGIGWNLGNTFDCYSLIREIKTPEEQIMLWGNEIPTKDLFINIKKYGFKTIRFPITWMHFMDDSGKINDNWMSKIKEVVDIIISLNMYCIINIHHDASSSNWLSKGGEALKKFIVLWKQIAEVFKNYDYLLIFESMNDVIYSDKIYNYKNLLSFTQTFVDIVRNSGGNNKDRLLIISGANRELDLTCSPDYKIPIDPYNKIAISIHYYLPSKFTIEHDYNPWTYVDSNGVRQIVTPMTKWGNDNDYNEMFTYFEKMKKTYTNNGIPIIITEVGILTEEEKEQESIREYLLAQFSISGAYDGIMSCLWDNSNKEKGDVNYYDRKNNKFYDEIIGENFKKISKGKYPNPTNFYIITNIESTTSPNSEGYMHITIGTKKVVKATLNVNILTNQLYSVGFGLVTTDKNGIWNGIPFSGEKGKREYDGSYTFIFNDINKEYNNYVEFQKWWGHNYTVFNYFTLEYEQNYKYLNISSYKYELLNLVK